MQNFDMRRERHHCAPGRVTFGLHNSVLPRFERWRGTVKQIDEIVRGTIRTFCR